MLPFDIRPVLHIIGFLLIVVAIAMVLPMVTDLVTGNADWIVFGASSAVTLFFGTLLLLANWTPARVIGLRQMFLLTALAWIVACFFSSLPYMLGEPRLGMADAYFEAMSGLTTTGSTVIVDLDDLPPGILLWRSVTQWLGGLGIVVVGIAVLPFLRIGGMQLFRSESSDRSEKVLPRAGDLAVAIGWVYLTLTTMCMVALVWAGMAPFDALNHSMTAVATGGFSTRDSSIGFWQNAVIEWVLVVFMTLGALPFVRLVSLVRGDAAPLWRDPQVRAFLGFLTLVSLAGGTWLSSTAELAWHEGVRLATFNIVSVVTGTGYASADYSLWGPLAVAGFLILPLVGGCTGSTTGGIKIFRFQILFLALRAQLIRLFSPNRLIPLTYGNKPVQGDILIAVMAFGFVFAASVLIGTVVLSAMGADIVTAVSGSATAFANVGPGLGPVIGPAGNFAPLSDSAKCFLSAAMLFGRLEFFTVLVLFVPKFWAR